MYAFTKYLFIGGTKSGYGLTTQLWTWVYILLIISKKYLKRSLNIHFLQMIKISKRGKCFLVQPRAIKNVIACVIGRCMLYVLA